MFVEGKMLFAKLRKKYLHKLFLEMNVLLLSSCKQWCVFGVRLHIAAVIVIVLSGIGNDVCLAQNRAIDSLQRLLTRKEQFPPDTEQVNLLWQLAKEYGSVIPQKGLMYGRRGVALADSLGYKRGLIRSLDRVGDIYRMQSFNDQSLEYHFQALRLSEQTKDTQGIYLSLRGISVNYAAMKSYAIARQYLYRASLLVKGDSAAFLLVLNSMGVGFFWEKQYDSAFAYFQRAASLNRTNPDPTKYGINLGNIAWTLARQGKFTQALPIAQEALTLARRHSINRNLSQSANVIAEILDGQGQYDSARVYATTALHIANSLGIKEMSVWATERLSIIAEHDKNYKEALFYARQLAQTRDSMQEKLQNDRASMLGTRYKEEQYEREFSQLQLALFKKNAEQSALLRNSLIGGVLFTLALLGLALNRYRNKQRSESRLQQQQEKLEQQAQEIQITNTALQEQLETLRRTQTQLAQAEKMASLGTLVAGVAHELNTPIGVAVTAASTLDVRTKDFVKRYQEGGLKKSELDAYVQTAQTGADLTLRNLERAANLIQSFKQVAVDQTTDNKRRIGVKSYIAGIITSLEPKWKTTRHRVELVCDETLEMETYPGAIAQIITNLIDNSLLHGFQGYTEEGIMRIKVEYQATSNQVTITYSDNGKGIPQEVLPKIFDPFFTTKQAQGGTGLGMHIVYNLVTQKLGGEITCQTTNTGGAEFRLVMPLVF
jgi:signal transduction histidine kinase/tetratricopeptide (TPR) repeat protein